MINKKVQQFWTDFKKSDLHIFYKIWFVLQGILLGILFLIAILAILGYINL
jgi:hypothetical protein